MFFNEGFGTVVFNRCEGPFFTVVVLSCEMSLESGIDRLYGAEAAMD